MVAKLSARCKKCGGRLYVDEDKLPHCETCGGTGQRVYDYPKPRKPSEAFEHLLERITPHKQEILDQLSILGVTSVLKTWNISYPTHWPKLQKEWEIGKVPRPVKAKKELVPEPEPKFKLPLCFTQTICPVYKEVLELRSYKQAIKDILNITEEMRNAKNH